VAGREPMTHVQLHDASRQMAPTPIYQTLHRAGTGELISLHVDERQAAGDACILCRSDDIAHIKTVAYGRLLGADTDLLVCAACTDT
jgi:hypothetical protein